MASGEEQAIHIAGTIELYRLLGEYGSIKRAVLMPDGQYESDSHHSFSLALIAFDIASRHAPELDMQKLLLYALVHDLPELVSGDIPTLTMTSEELNAKAARDDIALRKVCDRLSGHPRIIEALQAYEAKADDESLFVYWLDKMITIPTHFFDDGANLKALGIRNQQDIQAWYKRTLDKLQGSSQRTPHHAAVKVLEQAYQKMHDELLPDKAEQQPLD